ncbi:MAG: hypothetical protein MUC89_15910 [Acetobacteraceae bacterium]|nr:hypothetical protein [Acetobacteraceae bacterium]
MTKRFTTPGAMVAMGAVSGDYFIGLGKGETGEGLIGEAAGGGYARQAVTVVANGPTGTNAATVVFSGFTTSQGSFTHAGLFTAATGGTCIWVGPLLAPVSITAGGTIAIPDGALTLTIETIQETTAPAPPQAINREIAYNAGLFDFRADNDSLVSTAGGAVSALTSGQGFAGTFTQSAPANQPQHSTANDWVSFGAASTSDTAGDFLTNINIRDLYRSSSNALGVFYLLFRYNSLPTWNNMIVRVGAQSDVYTNFLLRGYGLRMMSTGLLWLGRGGNNTNENRIATLSGAFAANEWIACAFVLNDSRSAGTTTGAADQISRLFAKTKPTGSHPTLSAAATTAQFVPADPTVLCEIGRSRFNGSSVDSHCNDFRLHSLGFDSRPPISDQAIETVLDTLLARV